MKRQLFYKEGCEGGPRVPRRGFAFDLRVVGLSLGLVAGLMAAARDHEVVGLMVACLAAIAMFLVVSKQRDPLLRFALCVAIVLRTVLAVAGQYLVILPDSDVDAVKFEETGWQIASSWLNQEAGLSLRGWEFYSAFIAVCYAMFGRVPLVPVIANVCFGVLTVLVLHKIAALVGACRRSAGMAALVMAVFPTDNLYSAVLMRESITVMFLSLSVLFFFMWLTTGKVSHASLAIAFLMPGCILHSGLLFVGAAYCPFLFFYRPKIRRWSVFSSGSMIGLALVVVAIALAQSSIVRRLPSLSDLISAEHLGSHVIYAARHRAGYLVDLVPNSVLDVFLQTPVRVVYLLFAPFPWNVQTVGDLIAFFDGLLYIALVMESLRTLRRRQGEHTILLASLGILFMFLAAFAWGTSNFGAAVRHRHKIVCLLIAMASPSLASRRWLGWVFRGASPQGSSTVEAPLSKTLLQIERRGPAGPEQDPNRSPPGR